MEDDSLAEPIDDPLFGAASVFSMLIPRVDLHTPDFSATFVDGQRLRVPCAKFKPEKVTGAGDVWNAADIYGQGIGLGHKERLIFANAVCAAYLQKKGLEPASLLEAVARIDDVANAQKP
jgi:ribokinase